jgi:hypothetical protein
MAKSRLLGFRDGSTLHIRENKETKEKGRISITLGDGNHLSKETSTRSMQKG